MSGLGDAVKKGVGLVHGSGEALRGNFNASIDKATGDRESAIRHEAVASKGADEIDRGYHREHGRNAGVTPIDQDATRPGHEHNAHSTNVSNPVDPRYQTTVGGHAGSTNHGPHDTNVGNKLDPRYDSSTGGAASTHYGPHDSNTGNQLDQRYDSQFGARR
ncbi:hypothetical protein B0J11DRAFT_40482 [Dendryphion nanum]|uniref:Uncharacterized protein n=1 Tax=Dendryphion nanum TaxID=256645 RepID=A0A9P9ELJ8_9PLEO|nr:hypothetical protein B0J11DRAFT_40482 [Dendryphion nanum]